MTPGKKKDFSQSKFLFEKTKKNMEMRFNYQINFRLILKNIYFLKKERNL